MELDEPAAKLHHRNIHVTVRDIEDKNGNTMASPQTATFYVSNNSLEWLVNKIDVTVKYGSAASEMLSFYNWSASNHTYKIENCPKWLTFNKYTDVLAPQTMDYVTATVSKDLNIGTYNEILYLTDEEGIAEPLYLNFTVEGEQPDWAQGIDRNLLKNSMSISGQVYLYNELDTDSRDIVGAFDNANVCHGFANISHDVQAGETGLYLTVYDSLATGRDLTFRMWQYSTGREIVLTTQSPISFEKSAVLGTDKPVRFDGGEDFVQYFNLNDGWNWLSFNVSSKKLDSMYTLLNGVPWHNGDVVTDLSGDLALTFKDSLWYASADPKEIEISAKKSYAIKLQSPCSIPVGGTIIKDADERTINLTQGWNAIGYTPALNLNLETALSDYYDHAETGDVIKSQTEFAYFTKSGSTGRWRGSMQYMKPGEGDMLLRKGAGEASFTYPFYEPGSTFVNDTGRKSARARRATDNGERTMDNMPRHRYTMNVCAVAEGFDLEVGDRLVAFIGEELCGMAEVNDAYVDNTEPLYLSIGANTKADVTLAIERDGDIVAMATEPMTFSANALVGTPIEPVVISFGYATGMDLVSGAYELGKWYTVGGVQLAKKPNRPGVYIYNNKKVVIKK